MLVPKLRYKREDGTEYSEWKSMPLGERFTFKNGINASREAFRAEGIHCIGVSDVYKCLPITAENVIGTVAISDDEIEKNKVGYGDILFQRSSETKEDIGHASLYFDNTTSVCNGFVICAKPDELFYDPLYLHYSLQNTRVRKQTITLGAGSGQHYNIGQEGLAQIKAVFPCLEEQEKIADFIYSIDEAIAQSEAEVQNLEQQKKAAMQKIFSQEVRFRREDGTDYPEWKEKALSDISEFITKGTTPKKYSENGGINFVQINSIVDGAINTDKCLRIDEETHNGFLSRSVLFENDILCSIAGALGVIAVVNKDVLPANTNQALAIIRLNEGCNHRYIAFALSSYVMEKYIKQCKTVGAQPNLSLAQIRDMIVPFPCLKEQQKIADFLSAYDEAISYAKQELDKWKELKKGLLQQMFV